MTKQAKPDTQEGETYKEVTMMKFGDELEPKYQTMNKNIVKTNFCTQKRT